MVKILEYISFWEPDINEDKRLDESKDTEGCSDRQFSITLIEPEKCSQNKSRRKNTDSKDIPEIIRIQEF